MPTSTLHSNLLNLKAYKKDRVELAAYVINSNQLKSLLELAVPASDVSHQSCWTLEQCFLNHKKQCLPYMDEICNLMTYDMNSSAMRSLTKIASVLCDNHFSNSRLYRDFRLSDSQCNDIIDGCFNELIETDKTANLAMSIHCLYKFSAECDWIHRDLTALLEKRLLENLGRGFINSAKKTLVKLKQAQ